MTNLQETSGTEHSTATSGLKIHSQPGRHPVRVVEDLIRQGLSGVTFEPRVRSNLLESWGSYWLQIALPAVDLETLRIEVVGHRLVVGGTFHPHIIENSTFLRHELSSGEFVESFELPGEVEGDEAEAHYDAGVLTICLPKTASIKPTAITVTIP